MSNEHKYYIGKDNHSWEVGYDKGYQQGRADERDEMLKNAHRSLRLMYEKGKADAEKEHTEMCNSCIHKVSKEDIDAIRTEAIDECIQLVKKYYNLPTVMIVEGIEKLKEQNNVRGNN